MRRITFIWAEDAGVKDIEALRTKVDTALHGPETQTTIVTNYSVGSAFVDIPEEGDNPLQAKSDQQVPENWGDCCTTAPVASGYRRILTVSAPHATSEEIQALRKQIEAAVAGPDRCVVTHHYLDIQYADMPQK